MFANTRTRTPSRSPLGARVLALTVAALVGCDAESVLDDTELASESEAPAAVVIDALTVNPRTFEEELAAAQAPPIPRAVINAPHDVCGIVTGPAAVELDAPWAEARGVARLRVALERPDDAELSIDVAVVVDGETVAELPGAFILGADELVEATHVPERAARPWEVALELDADSLGLDALTAGRGMLVLIARVRRSDGALDSADRPLHLFFERGGDGVRFFDEATGSGRGLARSELSLAATPELGGEPATATIGEGLFAAAATDPQHLDVDIQPYVSVKLCMRHSVTFVDAGIAGEDYWTAGTAAYAMTGADARVYVDGQKIWDAPLGDGTSGDSNGEGCTPYLWIPRDSAPAVFYDTDMGVINGNNLRARTKGGSAPSTMVTFGALAASGTYVRTGTNTSSVYPVYLAIAKAMRAHDGGYSGVTYNALTLHDDGSRYDSDSEEIRILSGDEAKKFLVVHEYGHAFGDKTGDGYLVGGDCSKTSSDSDCSSGGSHGMTSIEWQSCAVNEGFAHFVAADTFNNHAQDDCAFRYWGSNHGDRNVDCEGASSHVAAWMENMCVGESFVGAGVELDWLRQFWDVHTNGGSTNMLPFMQWIRASGGWTKTSAYDELNTAAQAHGGDIKANWNVSRTGNGIDH
jgi:hypothetical protein